MTRSRNFLLLVTLAAAAVAPGLGQSAVPSLPDFSGLWAHANPGFEPLSSGPTALVNRSRRPNGTGDILKLAGDYTNPILTPEAVGGVKKHRGLRLHGPGHSNPRNQSWSSGGPFVFSNGPTPPLQ